ncbi:MAG TPA: hypothetical protein VGH27_19320 [Streptosporangiaceae bacterium]|jgi:hypothetical protein
MEDDSRVAPLSRRAPGDSGGPRPPAGTAPPVLSPAALRVARAALDAAREHDRGADSVLTAPGPGEPSVPWFVVDPEADTQPIPVITAAVAQPAAVAEEAAETRDEEASEEKAAAPAPPASPPPPPGPPLTPYPAAPSPVRRKAVPPHAAYPDEAGSGRGAGRRRYRLAGVLVSGLVLLGAGSLALALSWHPAGNTASAAAAASQQTIRDDAAAWVSSQVIATAVVSCDAVMCQALQAHGMNAASLLTLGRAGVSPLSSSIVVDTAAVRSEFGSRLGSRYAPIVLASFGSGSLRIDVRAIAPHGASAYLAAVKADQQDRAASGAQLLRTERITVPPLARRQLDLGQVDTRLLVVLANLAALQPVSVVSFGPAAPGASPGVPLRAADLAVPDGSSGGAQPMISILRDQTGMYVPAGIQTLRLTHGRSAVRVEFSAPSPLGLLGPLDRTQG